MDKKKILSSLALAGILTAGVLGANVNAATAEEYLKPVGVYKKLVDGETVVPYVLKGKNSPVKVNDIKAHFTNLESVNGKGDIDTNLSMGTGKTFKADGIDYKLVVYGDVNGDGKISTMDALAVQKAVVTKKVQEMEPIAREAADVKNDGKISTMDALAIQKYAVNKSEIVIDELPESAPAFVGIEDGQKFYAKRGDTTFKLPKVTITNNAKFEMEGNYDINVEGEYKITYLAEGSLGNETKATITVVVDGTAPNVTADYNIKTLTNQNVIATIISDEELQEVEGWALSENKKSMTKEYNKNATEDVTVKDSVGNEATITITIANIDKEPPVVTGVENDGSYKTVTPSFTEGVATLQKDGEEAKSYITDTEINADGKYILVVKDALENENTINFTIDNVAPVFEDADPNTKTLEPITLKKGDTLPEVTAWDEVDEERVPVVVIKKGSKVVSSIDTETGAGDGAYTVTYTAKDRAENEEVVTRKVTVDATPAEASKPVPDTTKVAKSVMMTVEFNEKMQEQDGWTIDTTGKVFFKTYTENVDEVVEFKDLAGNITSVPIELHNINALAATVKYSKTGLTNQPVTATITAEEEMQEIEGWTLSKNEKSMTKVYDKNTIEDVTIYDKSGDKEVVITVKIENIDTEKPILTPEFTETNPTKGPVGVTIKSDKALKTVPEGWTLQKNKIEIKRNENYTKNTTEDVTVTDTAGNQATITITVTNIDTTKPKVIDGIKYSNVDNDGNIIPTNEPVIVTIEANEELQEVAGWTLSEDGKSITKEYENNTAKAESVTITDLAGNTFKVTGINVQGIDKETPVVSGLTQEISTYSEVTLSFADDNNIIAKLQKGNDEPRELDTTTNTTVSEIGTYRLLVEDIAGNKLEPIIFRIVDITINGVEEGKVYQSVTPTFEEGIGQISKKDENGDYAIYEDYKSETLIEEDGEYDLVVTIEDGTEEHVHFIIDNVGPKFTAPINNKAYKANVTPKIQAKGQIVSITLKKDGNEVETYKSLKAISEEGNYELTVVDEAGNSSTVNFTIDKTFKGVPQVSYSNGGKPNGQNVTVKITAEEKIQAKGWTSMDNGMTITKVYSSNSNENVIITDLAGNEYIVTLDVKVTK